MFQKIQEKQRAENETQVVKQETRNPRVGIPEHLVYAGKITSRKRGRWKQKQEGLLFVIRLVTC